MTGDELMRRNNLMTNNNQTNGLGASLGRRQFLRRAGAASVAASVTMTGLRVAPADALTCGPLGNRSLVCIHLDGGADGFNMYSPLETSQSGSTWDTYAATRGPMALPRGSLIPAGNGDFGFNQNLPAFADLFNRGDLAVVSNVGPLTGPTTPTDVQAGRRLPQSLFAHDAQARLWQTATATVGGAAQGWGGQIAEVIDGCDNDALVSAAVSALGSSVFLSTAAGGALRLTPNQSLRRMSGYDPTQAGWYPSDQRQRVAAALRTALDAAGSSTSELERLVAGTTERAIITNAELEDVTSSAIDMARGGTLQAQLRLVAQLINNRDRLRMTRQVFFVTMGGWDTHGDQNRRLPVLLNKLNSAVGAFQQALGPNGLDVADSVTTFTTTDFGRTLTSNGDGTDHAWGNHAFVIGGSVNGGRHFGEIPSFATANNPDDVGTGRSFGGRLVPQFSVGQYGATLARWAGVDDEAELDAIFPDLREFDTRNLGFMLS